MKSVARLNLGYWQATRHPLVCVVFVLPLLLAYEWGIGQGGADAGPRNGADVWLRDLLFGLGLTAAWAAPALILAILLTWGVWRRQLLPTDLLGTALGMTVESGLFAAGLFGLSQAMVPLLGLLQRGGLVMSLDPTCQQILRYLGAGLYEETLFRLLLFSGLWGLFLFWEMPAGMAFLLAGIVSALAFAGAHHIGVHGEPFHPLIFLFRACAGWYFAWLFHFRGFGIAVGAHVSYDVLVGLLAR